jgi:hypothetical protein
MRWAAALLTLCALLPGRLAAQSPTELSGSWTLDHESSQFPTEIGFSASFIDTSGIRDEGRGRGRADRRGPGLVIPGQETIDDGQRVRFLTDEVRVPYEHLTIAVTPAMTTITPDRAPARVFHPGRRNEEINLGPVTGLVTSSWDGARLVIDYTAEASRTLRYTYALDPASKRLIVDTEFIEGGQVGDKVRRVYRAATPADRLAPPPETRTAAAPTPARTEPPPAPPEPALDQSPDADLKGLTHLGIVLEGLSPDAAKCGLEAAPLRTAIEKHLTDAGFRIDRNTDDDTYLYVNINTVSASAGLCVSRYDVTVYSHAAAKLAYGAAPVLLQAELLRRGGIAGGGPAAHGDAVRKGVLEYIDQFTDRIRAANR